MHATNVLSGCRYCPDIGGGMYHEPFSSVEWLNDKKTTE